MGCDEFIAKCEHIYGELAEVEDMDNSPDGVILSSIASYGIHIYHGLDILAEECGAVLVTKLRKDEEYPFEAYFTHNGIYYFQLLKRMGHYDE